MDKIYSTVQPGLLLHIVFRRGDAKQGRTDIIHPDNYIQCASIVQNAGTTFKPHKHKVRELAVNFLPQESWIVLRGKVRCDFYDLDGKILREIILHAGDASFTLAGGHNYYFLTDSEVMEYKTGPYHGHDVDKELI